MSHLLRFEHDGCPLTAHSEQAAADVNGQVIGYVGGVVVFAYQQATEARRTEYGVVCALVIGLAWADQPGAVEAVLGVRGDEGQGVFAIGFGSWGFSLLSSSMHRTIGLGRAFEPLRCVPPPTGTDAAPPADTPGGKKRRHRRRGPRS